MTKKSMSFWKLSAVWTW